MSRSSMASWHRKRLSLLLLLSFVQHVASVSLSSFQQIAGFSGNCMATWIEQIPGCSTEDFTEGHACSSACITGVTLMSLQVNQACASARVKNDTLLGAFLDGSGITVLCPNTGTASTSQKESASTSSPETSQTIQTSSSTREIKTSTTSTTSTEQTMSQRTTSSTSPPSTVATNTDSITRTSASVATSTSSQSTLEISFGATVTNTAQSQTTTYTSSVSTTTADPEAKGFGGVGNAFNILGNEASGERLSEHLIAGSMMVAVLLARTIW